MPPPGVDQREGEHAAQRVECFWPALAPHTKHGFCVAGRTPVVAAKLPPQVEKITAWRAAIVAAAILLPTLLLLGQLGVFGFGLEQVVNTTTESSKAPEKTLAAQLIDNARTREVAKATLTQSSWVNLALLLHLVALAGAGLDAWIQNRGPSRPIPKVDVMW